jgi:hypothetical protein
MHRSSIEVRVKSIWLWPTFSVLINFGLDILWRMTYGLKPSLLYIFHILGLPSKDLMGTSFKLKGGLKIVHSDSIFTDFAQWLAIHIPEELIVSEIIAMDKNRPSSFSTTIEKKLDQDTRLELLKYALSDRNINIACGYLKFVPRLASIKVMLNRPTSEAAIGSQRWHRDWFVHRGINIFTAITDIHETKGMYSAIGLNEIDRRCEIPIHGNNPLVGVYDRDRVGDDQMRLFIDEAAVQHLKGPPGTTALVDSGWVYHKGGHLKEGYRLMIEISYQSENKPRNSRAENILESLNLVGHEQLDSLLDTRVRRYMTDSDKNKHTAGWVFHWLARRFTYFKVKNR